MRSILSMSWATAALLLVVNQNNGAQAFVTRPSGDAPLAAWGVGQTSTHRPFSVLSIGNAAHVSPSASSTSRRQTTIVTTSQMTTSSALAMASASSSDTHQPVRIIIAGAPASGKGTQCEKIQEHFGVVHLSTGDMLRAAVSAGSAVGKEAKGFMDAGQLVPDSTIIGVVKDRLEEADCQERGWLLDGFPRTQAQAQALADAGITAECFLFLNVPDEILVERVVGRRTDPETGKIYHMTFSPPDSEEIMKRLEQRSDDTEEKVKVRLEQFHANVDAVKGSYSDISVTIDGNQAPDVVSNKVFEAIESQIVSA